MLYNIKRLTGYALGFILFYAPLALFQRCLFYLLYGSWQPQSIHGLCFRIPIEHILDGIIWRLTSISMLSTLLLWWQPSSWGLFLRQAVPGRCVHRISVEDGAVKISNKLASLYRNCTYPLWNAGRLLPCALFGGILACSYCNFFLFDLLANYYTRGYFISLTSSLLLTAIMWVLVFGIFTKGGRGFCNFLCPVGAAQGLMHALGCKLPFVLRMRVDKNQCIGCGLCEKKCPMESAELAEGKAQINQHNCICCGVCQHACPVQAISYGRKRV